MRQEGEHTILSVVRVTSGCTKRETKGDSTILGDVGYSLVGGVSHVTQHGEDDEASKDACTAVDKGNDDCISGEKTQQQKGQMKIKV